MVTIAVERPRGTQSRDASAESVEAHDVLVSARRAMVCGSDRHILHGANPLARTGAGVPALQLAFNG